MKDIIKQIKEIGEEVLKELGPYYKEETYEEAFVHELRLRKIPYERQRNVEIIYKGYSIGIRKPDCILYPRWSGGEEEFLIEMKAQSKIETKHRMQAEVYLASLNIPEGVVLNFNKNENKIEIQEVRKPERMIEKEILFPSKSEEKDIKNVLLKSAQNVMEYLGTEFFYQDKGKELYIEAIGVEFRLQGLDYHRRNFYRLYKNHKVAEYEYEYIFPEGEVVKVITYKKEKDLEPFYEEVAYHNKIFGISKGFLLGLPEKEGLKVLIKEL